MSEIWKMLPIVCPLVFLAGFVDSVAGGGGLISLPAYMLVGLPAHLASGTNKVANGVGTAISVYKYSKSGNIRLKMALPAAAGALAGSALGARLALMINAEALKVVILCALPVMAAVILLKRDFGAEEREPKKSLARWTLPLCVLIGLVIGCYDGMIGPGTGTLMILAFTAVTGVDLLTASGCAKVANLASNIAAAAVWIAKGQVLWELAGPAAVCSILGNYAGSRFAIKGGAKRVRALLMIVLMLIFVKIICDML